MGPGTMKIIFLSLVLVWAAAAQTTLNLSEDLVGLLPGILDDRLDVLQFHAALGAALLRDQVAMPKTKQPAARSPKAGRAGAYGAVTI